MTQEEKQLLLKDLCARLFYNVIVRCTDSDTDYKCFLTTDILHEIQNGYEYYDYKPYLRPISSMTEEEWLKLKEWIFVASDTKGKIYFDGLRNISAEDTIKAIDYLNAHHFDYRGLIPIGLALEAKEGMYKIV